MVSTEEMEYFVRTQMEDLFLEWMDLPATQDLVEKVLSLAACGNLPPSDHELGSTSTHSAHTLDDELLLAPVPFFSELNARSAGDEYSKSPRSTPPSPRQQQVLSPTSSTLRHNIPIPRAPEVVGSGVSLGAVSSPPRSPSHVSPNAVWVDESFALPPPSIGIASPRSCREQTPLLASTPAPVLSGGSPARIPKEDEIPVFYFPRKMAPSRDFLAQEEQDAIDHVFMRSTSLHDSSQLVNMLVIDLCVSRYFAEPVWRRMVNLGGVSDRHTVGQPPHVTKTSLTELWKRTFVLRDGASNLFHIIKQDSEVDYLVRSDFREFMWILLNQHPGLCFLRDSPEFQERYAETVISRIFFEYDFRRTGKIFAQDLRRNNSLLHAISELDRTDDINTVRRYFSYEHFYVLYCKFWDLDTDHDFLIEKVDFAKYDGHAYSGRAIERVFAPTSNSTLGSPKSAIPAQMTYEQFVWFILSDEDKSSDAALEYFFNLVDLDGDGVIRDHEMRWFYEEQMLRLRELNQEPPSFADIMCQMNDLIKPGGLGGQFKLEHFKKRKKQNSGAFFSILLSLNKFLAFEQRDPFQIKQDLISNPEWTDWDKFCAGEYMRLALEATGQNVSTTGTTTTVTVGNNSVVVSSPQWGFRDKSD